MTLRIGIIGDYDPKFRPHTATNKALKHAAVFLSRSFTRKQEDRIH